MEAVERVTREGDDRVNRVHVSSSLQFPTPEG